MRKSSKTVYRTCKLAERQSGLCGLADAGVTRKSGTVDMTGSILDALLMNMRCTIDVHTARTTDSRLRQQLPDSGKSLEEGHVQPE